jgi:hypothetical protein
LGTTEKHNSRAENSNGSQRAQTNGVQNTGKDLKKGERHNNNKALKQVKLLLLLLLLLDWNSINKGCVTL